MRDLHRYVIKKYAADWKNIGLELGLQFDTLKIIKQNNPLKVEDCLEDVLDRWLKSTRNATWRTLEVALTNMRRQRFGRDPVHDVYSGEINIIYTTFTPRFNGKRRCISGIIALLSTLRNALTRN